MRVQCPGCAAAYEVPLAHLAPGRPVCCARCGMLWKPLGEAPGLPSADEPGGSRRMPEPPAVAAVRRAAVQLRRPALVQPPAADDAPHGGAKRSRLALPRTIGWAIGWAASIVLVVGTLAAASHWRGAVMQSWPASTRLYSALGAEPSG